MNRRFLAFVITFLPSVIPLLGQESEEAIQTVRVPVARDAVLFGEDTFDGLARANGKGDSLTVGALQAGLIRRALIDFEPDRFVSAGAIVQEARLVLTPLSALSSPALFIFPLDRPWSPGVTDPEDEFSGELAQNGDVTWLYRNYNTVETSRVPWQTETGGGDFNPDQPLVADFGVVVNDDTNETDLPAIAFTSEAFVADVQRLINEPDAHFGWILLGEETNLVSNAVQFASGDYPEEINRPMLEITFAAPSDVVKVVTNYDALTTVGGRGEDGGRDNHWRGRYEGGPALDAELSRPAVAVEAADGTLYVTDTYAHSIRRIDLDGTIHTVAGSGAEGFNGEEGDALEIQLDQPNGLAVMPNGNLYILDIDNQRIRKVTPDGQLSTVFHDTTDPPFLTGRGLWVSPDESTIVYGSRTAVKQWSGAAGTIEVLAEGFERVSQLDFDPHTKSYLVTDIDDGTIWRVPVDGGSREHIAGGGRGRLSGIDATEAELEQPRGLAAAGHGGYFVATEDGARLWYMNPDGIAYVLLRGTGNGNLLDGDGQVLRDLAAMDDVTVMSQCYSVSLSPYGDLVLVTNETGFIRRIPKGLIPTLTGFGMEDGLPTIRWASQPQRFYLIESSEDLLQWSTLTDIASSRNDASFADAAAEEHPTRHYRVRFYYP